MSNHDEKPAAHKDIDCDGYPSCLVALATIGNKLESIEKQQTVIADAANDLNKKLFVGNGQPPLVMRVDRLEQSKKHVAALYLIAFTALITAVCTVVAEYGLWKMESGHQSRNTVQQSDNNSQQQDNNQDQGANNIEQMRRK